MTQTITRNDLRPGLRLGFWFDTGAMGVTIAYCTVVRVNRTTVTIRNENTTTQRVSLDSLHLFQAVSDETAPSVPPRRAWTDAYQVGQRVAVGATVCTVEAIVPAGADLGKVLDRWPSWTEGRPYVNGAGPLRHRVARLVVMADHGKTLFVVAKASALKAPR